MDDALDYSSTEEEFGKGVGQDLVEGKMTLPLFYSLKDASEPERARISDILVKSDGFDEDELSLVREIVDRYRGVEKTKDVARNFIHKARSAISSVPEGAYKNSLGMLADYVIERTH